MKKTAIIFILTLIVLSACKKSIDVVKPDNPGSMNEIQIPSAFTWKTSHDVQVTLTGFVNGIAEVTSPAGVVYQRAFLQQDKPYTMKVTVPAYETLVHLKFMGQDIETTFGSGNVTHIFLKP